MMRLTVPLAPKKKTRTAEPPPKVADDQEVEGEEEGVENEDEDEEDEEEDVEDGDEDEDAEETAPKGGPAAAAKAKQGGVVPKEDDLAEVEEEDEE